MKKVVILLAMMSVLFSSCGTMTGFFAGGALGGAIGGIMGGPRGHDIGTLIGMATGTAVGAAVDATEAKAAAEAANRERHFDEVYAQHRQEYANHYYQKNKPTDATADAECNTKEMVDPSNSGNDIIEMK